MLFQRVNDVSPNLHHIPTLRVGVNRGLRCVGGLHQALVERLKGMPILSASMKGSIFKR